MENLNSLEATILRILEGHRGKENAIGRFDLVDQVNGSTTSPCIYNEEVSLRLTLGAVLSLSKGPVNERLVRRTIKHLVESHGQWIGSCVKGYFMIQTDQELRAACKYYHGYAMSLLHVEARLRKMSLPALLGQLSLEFQG